MQYCKKGHKLILATGEIRSFWSDSEPYEPDLYEEPRDVAAFVRIGILFCEECDSVERVWVIEPDIQPKGSSDRFRHFLSEIVADGGWEYGDGTSMTEDAARFMASLKEADNESQD